MVWFHTCIENLLFNENNSSQLVRKHLIAQLFSGSPSCVLARAFSYTRAAYHISSKYHFQRLMLTSTDPPHIFESLYQNNVYLSIYPLNLDKNIIYFKKQNCDFSVFLSRFFLCLALVGSSNPAGY